MNDASTYTTIPNDDPQRNLTVADAETLPHIAVVGDTYTILVHGKQTAGRYCLIDMHIPKGGGPPLHRRCRRCHACQHSQTEQQAGFCARREPDEGVSRPEE